MLLVRNIRLPLSCPNPEAEAVRRARRTLGLPPGRKAGRGPPQDADRELTVIMQALGKPAKH